MNETKDLYSEIEELILKIAEKDFDSVVRLTAILQDYEVDTLPEAIKKLLTENFSIIMEDLNTLIKNSAIQELIMLFAGVGIDSMALRDAFAAVIREVSSTYPDPSGLINALGIFELKQTPKEAYRRWNVFSVLKQDSIVWHSSYGLGHIVEIDSFSDLVYIKFKSKQHLNLAQSLTSLSVAKPNTLTSTLTSEAKFRMPPGMSASEFESSVTNDFIPKLKEPELVVESLLVPKWMDRKTYLLWRTEKQSEFLDKSKAVQERAWNNARSLEELKVCLTKVKSIKPKEDGIAHLRKIFTLEAVKPLSKFIFAETISTLWSYCPSEPWLSELIKDLPEDTVAWTSKENFIEVTRKLSAKLVPHWLLISDIANEREGFIDIVTELPLRFWPSSKHALMSSENFVEDLSSAAVEKLRAGKGSADIVIWVWRNCRETAERVLTNPSLIVRILNKTVKGEFLKAYKELYKLLLENQEFQKALMGNGSVQGIKTFVKTIKGTSVLNKGEQQSLLVKIIRIYPEAQQFVEEKNKVVATRAIPKKTSIKSFEQRRQELEEIINIKIPKNSAAIAHARSYGDLRENAEYKAAKEEQRLLMARRQEFERDLKEIIATDFSDVRVGDTVIPGCTVEVIVDGKNNEIYHILGLWDSNPDKNILSYDTPLGRLLIGKKVGDKLTTPRNLPAEIKSIRELPQKVINESVNLPEGSVV